MKITKRNANKERQVLAAMVRNRKLLATVAGQWGKGGLFGPNDKILNELGSLCVVYHNKHGKAPRKLFPNLVADKYVTAKGEKVEQVEAFMDYLSGEPANGNLNHLIELAEEVFNKAACLRWKDQLEEAELQGTLGKEPIEPVKHISLKQQNACVDFFENAEAMDRAFQKPVDPLITYDGDLGIMLGDCFVRKGFVSFMAREKGGKSWWLVDVTQMGVDQGHRVAYFTVGDMDLDEIEERFAVRISETPAKRHNRRTPYRVRLPREIDASGECRSKNKTFERLLSRRMAQEVREEYKAKLKQDRPLKIIEYASGMCGVRDIHQCLEQWESKEDWRPDVVVVDYADILAFPASSAREEYRHRIDANWQQLRSLAQQWDCCVVTATQAKRMKYSGDEDELLTPENISEDKRKLAHVTAMFGLNRTRNKEQTGDLCRVNCLARRKGRFDPKQFAYVAGCLDIARPAIASYLIL